MTLFATDSPWTWNTKGDSIEINLHHARVTVVLTARDIKRMDSAQRLAAALAATDCCGDPGDCAEPCR